MLVKDAAAIAAKEFLNEYWDGSFPVDPVSIARSLGIDVQITSLLPGISGAIVSQEGSASILIEEADTYGRQMFTCAHEIGHFQERKAQNDLDYSFVERRTSKYDLHELYADVFAANLLMPEDEFRAQWARTGSEYLVAGFFGVSPSAALARKERLKIG